MTKKLLNATPALFAAAFLFLTVLVSGCSSNNPGAVVERFYQSIEKGEIEEALEFLSPKFRNSIGDGKLKTGLQQATRDIKEKGGIKTFEIVEIEEIGEVADVKVRIEYGNGTQETEEVKLAKEDGKWLLEPSK